ncbi:hypothetical protein [Roseateles microcysteis]|uniref:hypothetical protein n=1 Tax=Roseateles microcysteis TaxID=3119057 RepID=UPI002FE5F400
MALALAGCASTPTTDPATSIQKATPTSSQQQVDASRQAEFDKSLAAWRGAPVQELRAKLGAPSAVHAQRDGSSIYVYTKSAKLAGANGPVDFQCVVRYLIDGRSQRVSGMEVEGC